MKVLKKNCAKCLVCGDVVESKHCHDFRWCKCGNMAVDGGLAYLKRSAKKMDMVEDCSEYEDRPEE